MMLVCARLGENLDASVAELVVFSRERILVDADLANGFLGWNLAPAEAIYEDRSAVGTSGRAGERLQVALQVVWIVGERLQVVAPQHHRAGVSGGIDAERIACVPFHIHLLSGYGH